MSELFLAKCRLLGINVTPVTLERLLSYIGDSILSFNRSGKSVILVGHNLHSAYLFQLDPGFRSCYASAEVILADGAPVLWDCKLSGSRIPMERLGSTDWIPALDKVPALKRMMVVGAASRTNSRFVSLIQEKMPYTEILGFPGEGWNSELEGEALECISTFKPDMLLIGLGMPLQERFALRVWQDGGAGVIAAVGGAIDQLTGVQKNAPRWLGKIGLEWLWRLLMQPRRLANRYLIEPWHLLLLRVRNSKVNND